MHWRVTTEPLPNGKGHVINIPFEQRVSDVTEYRAEYWLLFKGDKNISPYTNHPDGYDRSRRTKSTFSHVTCNTVTHA
jgi:hypothetical protein